MKARIDYYENVPIEEYEQILANREYWDNISGEWGMLSKMEEKLIRLGIFVQRGGDLNRVIALYAEGREYDYRVTIQHCIERYIGMLSEKRISNLTIRLYKLEKEEAVKLLAEMLKAGVKRVCDQDRYSMEWHAYGSVDSKNLDGEDIFAAIEQKHQETYSGETIEEVKRRVNKWRFESLW